MSHSSNRSTTNSGRSSVRTKLYLNFHGNTCLAQTQIYFDLSGTSHIVHSLAVEMDSANWNPHGHSVDILYPSGQLGGTGITVDLLTYKAVWSGEQVKPLFILSFVLYFTSFGASPLRHHFGGEVQEGKRRCCYLHGVGDQGCHQMPHQGLQQWAGAWC